MIPPVVALAHPFVRECRFPGQFYFLLLLKSALSCCTKCVVEVLCFSNAAFKRSKFLLMRAQSAGLEVTRAGRTA